MKNLIKNFQNFSHEHSLWKKGDRIVLGISGGPDSMALLDIFLKLREKYALELIVAHVNYGLRGEDSQKDEALVRKVARENDLEFILHAPQKKISSNKEEAWRKIRYAFFEKIRKEKKFDLISVAHTADDQVETFFLNLFRGSGKTGLSGMKMKNDHIIRPLLFVWKKDILEHDRKNSVSFRIDKTNRENNFQRNKIRNLLLPQMEKLFGTSVKNNVLRACQNLSQDETALFSGSLRGISANHIREILKILKSPKNKKQTLAFQGLKVERKGDKLTIETVKS